MNKITHLKEKHKMISKFYNMIPELKVLTNINPNFYITGNLSKIIMKKVNGKKSIEYIAEELKLPQIKVYNLCKNLVKLGFITLNVKNNAY